jgi:hypothetical protein
VRVGRAHMSRRRVCRPRRGMPVTMHMCAFPHAITAGTYRSTPASCPSPLPSSPARASASPSSAPPARRKHGILPLSWLSMRPAARAIVHYKFVEVRAGAALLALSLYTELAFDEGKGALVRAALVEPAVRHRASALGLCQLTTPARRTPPPCSPSRRLTALHAPIPPNTRDRNAPRAPRAAPVPRRLAASYARSATAGPARGRRALGGALNRAVCGRGRRRAAAPAVRICSGGSCGASRASSFASLLSLGTQNPQAKVHSEQVRICMLPVFSYPFPCALLIAPRRTQSPRKGADCSEGCARPFSIRSCSRRDDSHARALSRVSVAPLLMSPARRALPACSSRRPLHLSRIRHFNHKAFARRINRSSTEVCFSTDQWFIDGYESTCSRWGIFLRMCAPTPWVFASRTAANAARAQDPFRMLVSIRINRLLRCSLLPMLTLASMSVVRRRSSFGSGASSRGGASAAAAAHTVHTTHAPVRAARL